MEDLINPGDRIATILPPSPELVQQLFTSMERGAIFCPLNPKLPPKALEAQIQRIQPKYIISAAGCERRVSHPAPLPPASLLLFTSGSTGTPKIASLSLQSFLQNAKSANAACHLTPGDGWRLSLPLHHVGGLSIAFRCRLAGAQLIFDENNPAITHLSLVPAQLYLSSPVNPKLRCILLGGGPIHTVPTQLPCLISYGMTETASLIMAGKTPSSLWPVADKEVKLQPDGELLVRGDSLFNGYWNGETLLPSLDAEGWFATNDLARFNPNLGYTIIGRKDRQFISGGENIQPEEIERALLQLPDVLEAVVGPRKHDRFGMRPVAYLKLHRGTIDPEKIRRHLLEELPRYKVPDSFFLLEERSTLKPNYASLFDANC